jgi:hypothetical protein
LNGCSGRHVLWGNSAQQEAQLLDTVLEDAHALRRELGAADRQRMDEYLSVVRSLEQRLERAHVRVAARGSRGLRWMAKRPEGIPKDGPSTSG